MVKRRKKDNRMKILAVLVVGFILFGGLGTDSSILSDEQKSIFDRLSLHDRDVYVKTVSTGTAFSIAGQQRGCSDVPDREFTVTATTSPRQTISCGSVTALVDIYTSNWGFIGEYENPVSFWITIDEIIRGEQFIVECYYCPDQPTECNINGLMRCKTDKQREECQSGEWIPSFNCPTGTSCFGAGQCSQDASGAICGDGICQTGESITCARDCDVITPPTQYCGDNICSSAESSGGFCPGDCGSATDPNPPAGLNPIIKPVEVVVSANNRIVTTAITIRNDGDNMPVDWLMEVQHQIGLPMAIVSAQRVCDPAHPENIHRTFKLNSGEQVTMVFTSPELSDGTYNVYAVSRDKCWATIPQGNNPVNPFKGATVFGTVKIGTDDVIPPRDGCTEDEFELMNKCYSKNMALLLAAVLIILVAMRRK